MDIVDSATRSRMMAGIHGRDTKIELVVRKALHARGLRYRLHSPNLPGRPDIAFAGLKAAIFINGCFWHGHDCPLFRLPGTNTEFWQTKIENNCARDRRSLAALHQQGWRTAVVWECALRGRPLQEVGELIDGIEVWLRHAEENMELRGPSLSLATRRQAISMPAGTAR